MISPLCLLTIFLGTAQALCISKVATSDDGNREIDCIENAASANTTTLIANRTAVPHVTYTNCVPGGKGTCTMGLLLSYSGNPMIALAYDHACELMGSAVGLHWDAPTVMKVSALPSPFTVTPHWDGAASHFTYEGRSYTSGWNMTMLNGYSEWYESLTFLCEA